jgi:hypothetical protein
MANPDYYDLRKLRTLVEPNMRKQSINPNTAYFNSEKFVPKLKDTDKKSVKNRKSK